MFETDFQRVTVLDRWDEAAGLVGLEFDLGTSGLAVTYVNPGQYVPVRVSPVISPTRVAYMALASRPGEAHFEFLVRGGNSVGDWLSSLAPGASVEIGKAMGPGYPIQNYPGTDVLLLAVGSGISPIRPLLWYLAAHRAEYRSVTLFCGARTAEHLAYQNDMLAWQAEGIDVIRVLSQPATAPSVAGVVKGYVQEALAAHPLDPARSVVFLCGMPAMVQAVSEELARRGVGPERIFQNY